MISIDASVFLGMHCSDELVRNSCKSIVASSLSSGILISFEEIGRTDNYIWNLPRKKQEIYFSFMDFIMSESSIIKRSYEGITQELYNENYPDRLKLALSLNVPMYSLEQSMSHYSQVQTPIARHNSSEWFPKSIEQKYVSSKEIRIPMDLLIILSH